MNDDHVVCDFSGPRCVVVLQSSDQLPMKCLHCGKGYVMALPASVTMVALVAKQFTKEHRRCKPRPALDGLRTPNDTSPDEVKG